MPGRLARARTTAGEVDYEIGNLVCFGRERGELRRVDGFECRGGHAVHQALKSAQQCQRGRGFGEINGPLERDRCARTPREPLGEVEMPATQAARIESEGQAHGSHPVPDGRVRTGTDTSGAEWRACASIRQT